MDVTRLHAHVTQEFALLRVPLDEAFDTIRQRILKSRSITMTTVAQRLTDAVGRHGVKVKVTVTKEADGAGQFYYPTMTAQCFSPTKRRGVRIEMLLWQHPTAPRFLMSRGGVDYFQYRFYKMLQHELVHKAQFLLAADARESFLVFKPSAKSDEWLHDQQAYLCEIDEVEAYARDAVEEWYYIHPDRPLTPAALLEEYRHTRRVCSIGYYAMVFQADETHPAVLRFFNKTLHWNAVMTPMAHSLPRAPEIVLRPRKRPLVLE